MKTIVMLVIAHGQYLATNPSVTLTVEGTPMSRDQSIILHWENAEPMQCCNLDAGSGAADNQIHIVSYGEERH